MTEHLLRLFADQLSKEWPVQRAATQMTLGKLIETLEAMPFGSKVPNLHTPRSYRGYYEDIAFQLDEGFTTTTKLLMDCQTVMGRVLEGYKGGSYLMGERTPVWISDYGTVSGIKLMGFDANGKLQVATDD